MIVGEPGGQGREGWAVGLCKTGQPPSGLLHHSTRLAYSPKPSQPPLHRPFKVGSVSQGPAGPRRGACPSGGCWLVPVCTRTGARRHPASPGGSWGPEGSSSLQVATTAAPGTAAAMASCPDSDNSWVLAGSEVGKAGLGCCPGLAPCWGRVVTCTTSCIGEGLECWPLALVGKKGSAG